MPSGSLISIFETGVPGVRLSDVTSQDADIPLPSAAVAVIVAVPGAIASTLPVCVTVATASSEELHTTFLLVASAGVTVAIRSASFPMTRVSSVLLISMAFTRIGLGVTVMAHVAVFSPSVVVAVMVAFPGATAVILPFSSTLATASSEEVQETALNVAFSGAMVATSVASSPSTSSAVSLSRDTLSTG